MDYKRVLALHFTNEMSSREIAATTGEGNQRRKDNILINEPILSGIIAFLIPLSSYHIGRKIGKKQRVIFLVIYSLFILYETVFTRSNGVTRSIEMVPFWSYAQIHSVPIRNQVILNIFLFIPFGFLLPWARNLTFKKTLLVGCVFSIVIEAAQYIFCLGLCEFDDVFHNTLGTAIGYWYWRGLEHVDRRREKRCGRSTTP